MLKFATLSLAALLALVSPAAAECIAPKYMIENMPKDVVPGKLGPDKVAALKKNMAKADLDFDSAMLFHKPGGQISVLLMFKAGCLMAYAPVPNKLLPELFKITDDGSI